ncbi:hypothetical protein M404DRAFT_148351, partial [Pisolithus tinctorius Marx 270]
FRWIFIPWLQEELDSYHDRVNHMAKQHDCNKVLPHGVAELIFDSPQDYGALDLKASSLFQDWATLKHVRELYVDANHPVFDLVPRALNAHLEECYNILGRPAITRFTIWDVYLDLLHAVQDCALLPSLSVSLSTDTEANDSLPLLDGQRDLPLHKTNNGYYYMGRVGGGLSLGESTLGAYQKELKCFQTKFMCGTSMTWMMPRMNLTLSRALTLSLQNFLTKRGLIMRMTGAKYTCVLSVTRCGGLLPICLLFLNALHLCYDRPFSHL